MHCEIQKSIIKHHIQNSRSVLTKAKNMIKRYWIYEVHKNILWIFGVQDGSKLEYNDTFITFSPHDRHDYDVDVVYR